MSDLESRLDAVERTLTDDDRGPAELADAAAATDRLAACEARLDEVEAQVADLEAALQAVRGYVGRARREDRELERTAQRALATAVRVEQRLDDGGLDPEPLPVAAPDDADGEGPLGRLRDAL